MTTRAAVDLFAERFATRQKPARHERNRMANGRCATREEAMAAFREAFDRGPDNTVDKSA
jgi:hypothetical protein